MRSGNTFIVTGDLITGLKFRMGEKMMGQTFRQIRITVKIEIEVLDPDESELQYYTAIIKIRNWTILT